MFCPSKWAEYTDKEQIILAFIYPQDNGKNLKDFWKEKWQDPIYILIRLFTISFKTCSCSHLLNLISILKSSFPFLMLATCVSLFLWICFDSSLSLLLNFFSETNCGLVIFLYCIFIFYFIKLYAYL